MVGGNDDRNQLEIPTGAGGDRAREPQGGLAESRAVQRNEKVTHGVLLAEQADEAGWPYPSAYLEGDKPGVAAA